MSVAFKIAKLSAVQWLIVVGLAFAIIPVFEVLKLIYYFIDKSKAKKLIDEEVAETAIETVANKIVVVENEEEKTEEVVAPKTKETKPTTKKSTTTKAATKKAAAKTENK